MKVCEICGRIAYYDCAQCSRSVCDSHAEKCSKCGRWFCPKHIKQVGGEYVCSKCLSSRVTMYVALVAAVAVLLVGLIIVFGEIGRGLKTPDGELTYEWNPDAKTVNLILRLQYTNKSNTPVVITDVRFNDETLQSFYQAEYLEKKEIKKNESRELEIRFPEVPYETAQNITVDTGTLYWEKVPAGEGNTDFSFAIDDIEFPVVLESPKLKDEEIKEKHFFEVEIEVEVLDKIPKASRPLYLILDADDEKIVDLIEPRKELKLGRNSYLFKVEALEDGSTELTFRVVAVDEVLWGEKKLPISIGSWGQVELSYAELVDGEGNPLKPENGKYEMFFSTEEQTYRHWLTFSVSGRGEDVIVLVYFDFDYQISGGIRLIEPPYEKLNHWQGLFNGEERKGVLFVIPQLVGQEKFSLEFDNPAYEMIGNPLEKVLGVALIKITDENNPFQSKISQLTRKDIAASAYDLGCDSERRIGYEYCKKELTMKFEKKKEEVEPTPKESPTEEPEESTQTATPSSLPFSSPGPGKSIFLSYIIFFFLLLSYLSLRRGGIL